MGRIPIVMDIVAIGGVDYAPDMPTWMVKEVRQKWVEDPFELAMRHHPGRSEEPWHRMKKVCGFAPHTLLNLLPPSNKRYWDTKLAYITAQSIVEWAGIQSSKDVDCLFLVGRRVIETFTKPLGKVPFGEWVTLPTVPPLGYGEVACSFIEALCLPHPSRMTKKQLKEWSND